MKANKPKGAAVTNEQPENHAIHAKATRPMSPETKAKIAASATARWAKQKAAEAAAPALPALESPTAEIPPTEVEITPLVPINVIEIQLVEDSESPVGGCSQQQGQQAPEQMEPIEPSTLLGKHDHEKLVESIKDQLRACWQKGGEWRLEFGLLLIKYRKVTEYGEWIKFLKREFDLHRQTAWNWMRKAAEANGISLDESQSHDDEPDTHADNIENAIQEEQAKLKAKQDVKLNGPKPIRLILEGVTEDEKDIYKAELKSDRMWVQGILRKAFNEILAGKPADHTEMTPEDTGITDPPEEDDLPVVHTRKKLETLSEAAEEPTIYINDLPEDEWEIRADDQPTVDDSDLPEMFFEQQETE